MKIDWNKKYTTIAVYGFIVVAASIVFYIVLNNLQGFLAWIGRFAGIFTPFLLAFCIAYLLNPVLKWVEKGIHAVLERKKPKPKLKRTLGILITYILLVAVLALFSWVIFPQIVKSLTAVSEVLSKYVADFPNILSGWMSYVDDSGFIESTVYSLLEQSEELMYKAANLLNTAMPYIINFTKQLTSGISNTVIAVIVSIYMLMDKERFFAQTKKVLYAVFPEKYVEYMIDITHTGNDIFSKFIVGKLLDSAIIGVLCFAGMTVLRIPYALFISFIIGLTNIIPYFGPVIGAVVATLILLMISPGKTLWFLIFVLILQQFDGNILGPKILGKSTGLSAFWVIFAIVLFGSLFGIMGMFVGVPLFSVLYYLMRLFVNKRLTDKQMSTDTNDYASAEDEIL